MLPRKMLLKIEIISFIVAFIYILYFASNYFFEYLISIRKKKQEKIEKVKKRIEKKAKNKKLQSLESKTEKKTVKGSLTPEVAEKVREISNRAQINISRGYLDSARSLIIEWLALSKNDKKLNLLLADVYERENKYQNAEYIYRDLLDENGEDEYMLQRLWNIYTLRWKTEKSMKCYIAALAHDKTNTEILDILSHLAIELGDFKKALKFSSLFLKEKPRDSEKLSIKWYALEKLWKTSDAIKTYNIVLDLQPYNKEIQERIRYLQS